MKERFILSMPDPGGIARWMVVDEAGISIGLPGQGDLQEAAAAVGGRRCIVVVPGTDVLLSEAELPATSRKQLLRALPYALEDHLASDPDDLHFAPAIGRTDGKVHTAVVGRDRMDAWQESLSGAGIHADCLIPETLLVKEQPEQWQVVVDADHAIVRTGPWSGFAVEKDALQTYLELALTESEDDLPASVEITRYEDVDIELPGEINGVDIILNETPVTEGLLQTIVRGINEKTTINLLQGAYSRREQVGKLLKPWRPAAVLLLVWLAIQLGFNIYEQQRLSAEKAALQAEIESVYRSTFPDVRNIVNARVQMERAVSGLRNASGEGGASFLELLATGGKVLKTVPGLELRSAHFRNEQLIMEVTTKDIQIIDKFKQKLVEVPGLAVELQSASASQEGAVGRISLKRGES